ncbi:MAG: hypothetical protein AB1609_22675 [Bacillota bacterium]
MADSALLAETPEVEIGGRRYRLRRLKTADVFQISRLLSRAIANVGLGLLGAEDVGGAFRIIATLLGDELASWYASLLGITEREFAELPVDAAPAVLEALQKHPDYEAFLTSVSRHLNLAASVLLRPATSSSSGTAGRTSRS